MIKLLGMCAVRNRFVFVSVRFSEKNSDLVWNDLVQLKNVVRFRYSSYIRLV